MCVGWCGESGGGSGIPAFPTGDCEVAMSLFEEFVKTPDVLEALRGLRFRSERAWDDALWVPETRPWSLTCRDGSRC